MQVIAIDNNQERIRQPSTELQEKIKLCVSAFRSLNETVQEVIDLGQKEGFSTKEIGQLIRNEMTKAGLSRMTISRYLPTDFKAKPRGRPQGNSNNLLLNQNRLEFESVISSKGGNRKYINIPYNLTEQLKTYESKRVIVSIRVP